MPTIFTIIALLCFMAGNILFERSVEKRLSEDEHWIMETCIHTVGTEDSTREELTQLCRVRKVWSQDQQM